MMLTLQPPVQALGMGGRAYIGNPQRFEPQALGELLNQVTRIGGHGHSRIGSASHLLDFTA